MSDILPFIPIVTLFAVMTKPASRIVSTFDALPSVTFESVQLRIEAAMFSVFIAVAS